MKKLLMILAACATAMVAPAAVKTQVDFESGLGGFTGTGGTAKEYGGSASKPGQPYPFSGASNAKYCAVDADSTDTLASPTSDATCFDMYVQFPANATEPSTDSLGSDAKVAVYLNSENYVAVVHGGGTTTTGTTVSPGTWTRLTIAQVSGGYNVYIDGTAVSGSPFTAISSGNPSKVDFVGVGNLDNYVARTTNPFGGQPAGWVAYEADGSDPEQYYTDYTAALSNALNGASLTFDGGMDGTPGHPYEIRTLPDLKAFQAAVAGKKGLDKAYLLTDNITLDAPWPGIGIQNGKDIVTTAAYEAGAFQGTFDGQNHTISGFQMQGGGLDYCGFFNSTCGATIKNLKIQYAGALFAADTTATSAESGATFVGVAKNSTLVNLTSFQKDSSTPVAISKGFGGIVGYLMGSTVDSCTNNVSASSSNVKNGVAGNKVGGIAMICQQSDCSIVNCVNNGTPSTGSQEFGGILAYTGTITISNCQNTAACKMFHHHDGTVTLAGENKGNATVASYTGAATPGLNFATVADDVATFVADNALATDGTQYKVMNANAAYAFASDGSLALNEAITNATVTAVSPLVLDETVSGSVITYTAKAAQAIAVDESYPSVNVTEEWITDNVTKAGETATAEEIKAALATTDSNGLTKWENYVLGQNPSTPVKVNAEQGTTLTMHVGSTLKPQTADIGCTVKYSLAEVNASGTVVDSGTQQDATDFSIDLSQITSSAFFRMTASVSDGATTKTVTSTNVIGVLVVNDAPATTLIGVPFASLNGDGSISISNLVRTANLSEGDTISAYDPTTKDYRMWELNGGVWKPGTVPGSSAGTEGADTIKIGRGKGVWLTRQHPERPIYLVGGLATDAVSSSLEAGSGSEKTWNIVAPPSAGDFDLNTKLTSAASADDQILVPTKGAPKNFTFDGTSKKWGYEKKVYNETDGLYHSQRVEDATVPAGRGFWYINSTDKTSIGL